MHLEAHALLGWAVANLAQADRRTRVWCVSAAVLPDLDAISYLAGTNAYQLWHHTFGHNVFLWALMTALAYWKLRQPVGAVLVGLSFGSHLLTDFYFSGWKLYLFWPFSRSGYVSQHSFDLGHWVNLALIYGLLGVALLIALWRKRTPIELFSPTVDSLVTSVLRPKTAACGECSQPANLECASCGSHVCAKHARVGKRFRVECPQCGEAKPASASPS